MNVMPLENCNLNSLVLFWMNQVQMSWCHSKLVSVRNVTGVIRSLVNASGL